MEETLDRSTFMPTDTVFHKKLAKPTLLKTPTTSTARIFKNAKTVLHQQEPSPETKETAGLSRNIQSGKLLNMEASKVLTR